MATPYIERKDSVKDTAEANAKDIFLEALFSRNCLDIETVLQKQPALVNFEYKIHGTPLLMACSRLLTTQDEEQTGMHKFWIYF